MGSRKTQKERLNRALNAAAEALVLLDPDDGESVGTLVESLTDLCDLVGDGDQAVEEVRDLSAALGRGEQISLRALESAFERVRIGAGSKVRASSAKDKPEPSAQTMPLAGDADLLNDFGVRADEHLDDADERLLGLEAEPGDRESIDAVFRAFHTIKGMAGFLALDAISQAAHESENLLSEARSTGERLSPEDVAALFRSVDVMRALIGEATGRVRAVDAENDAAASSASASRTAATKRTESARAGTVRVSQERLDALLDTIGEMVIAESTVSAGVRESGADAIIASKLDMLDKITRELQQMATSLRMVPMRPMMRRMARLVHDVSQKAGKPVEFVMAGEDTELDKSVVDRIEDPLVHALRNAIDHGVESAEERAASGKPATARIELRAFHAGGAVHLEVRDDGRGLDVERIRSAAVRTGAATAETCESRSVLDLLCVPGLSTAESVSDVSGRGVGMDVVRRTVEELRGRLDVKSEQGGGTTFSIRLPVTLAIIDGMVLRVGPERFILPLLSIERSVRPVAEDVISVAGRGEMLAIGTDELVPLIRLHRIFGVADAEVDPTSAVVVVTHEAGARVGFLACELLGQQQTVIKPLGEGLPDTQGVAGGAVMPDGRVGLILDAAGLVRLVHGKGGE